MNMRNGQLNPVHFDQANKVMTAPGCGDLPVFNGDGQFISCWELTDEQIQDVIDNRRIWLSVRACGQPPVWLSTEYPFIDRDEWPEQVETK